MTAAEMAAADFYDVLKEENLYGLCIATDAKSSLEINGVYESTDHAVSLLAAMLVQLADKYNADQDVALMSIIFRTARIIGDVRSGEKGRGLKLNQTELDFLSETLHNITLLVDKAGRRKLKKALEV